MRACLILGLAVALSGCGFAERASNALLVTLDTTRADAIGVYGAAGGITPNIDRLAGEGITFSVARTVAPLTLPAHASMLTGLYPPRHGVRTDGRNALPASAKTLAESARAAGFDTAAFVSAPVLSRVFGLDQGFDTWEQPERARRREHVEGHRGDLSAEEVTARAVRWLEARGESARPFFLWVHYFDPHTPWTPPPHFQEQARGNLYLGEVARVDAAVGELIAALEALGELERTLVAVVGDHGESLGEHGEGTHGHFVYEAALRVPFIVRPPAGGPGSTRRGSADPGPVSVVDVFPTLAGAMALDAGPEDGIDLLASRVPEDRGVYFECYSGFRHLGWSPLAGWADASAKYVHSSSPELFVPHVWPDERVNRIHERAQEELDGYRSHLAEIAARPKLTAASEELPGPLDETGLPSPHSRATELKRIDRARALVLEGEQEGAVEILLEIVSVNPRNADALETLAEQYLQLQRPLEAIPVYEQLSSLSGSRGHAGMGRALEDTGRLEEALSHYRRAVELAPEDTETMLLLAAGLERTGAAEEAQRWREQARRALGY